MIVANVSHESERQRLEILYAQLEEDFTSFLPLYRDLNDNILPNRARFITSDFNKGGRRNTKIYDGTATLSARTLRSGMMSGITSPARPWFKLSTPDPGMAEFGPVKQWLDVVTFRMTTGFLRSNLYNVLPICYGDLGVFATAPIYIQEDDEDLFHTHSFPVGSYRIGKDHRGRVNVFARRFRMTVRQMYEKFAVRDERTNKIDDSMMSEHVRQLFANHQTEAWIEVSHFILPNDQYDPRKFESEFKRFKSVYYETGNVTGAKSSYMRGADDGKLLRKKGYDLFPVMCPRWEVTGEDVYGTDCPGMTALGDIKQLQHGEKKSTQAIDKFVNPPMQGPTALRQQRLSILPGDVTFVDTTDPRNGLRPIMEIQPRVMELEQKQQQIRQRIQRAFFEDLFLMLANDTRSNVTAREIEARYEEKLLALGPVLEQLNQDLLNPLIDNAFSIMLQIPGMIPPPPQDLQGSPLKVEYISVMAQAQKSLGLASMERFLSNVAMASQIDQGVIDKFNGDQWVDVYGDLLSMPTGIIRTDEEVESLRAQRAQAAQAQAQMEQMQSAAKTARDLSSADMEGDNALTEMIRGAKAGQLVGEA